MTRASQRVVDLTPNQIHDNATTQGRTSLRPKPQRPPDQRLFTAPIRSTS